MHSPPSQSSCLLGNTTMKLKTRVLRFCWGFQKLFGRIILFLIFKTFCKNIFRIDTELKYTWVHSKVHTYIHTIWRKVKWTTVLLGLKFSSSLGEQKKAYKQRPLKLSSGFFSIFRYIILYMYLTWKII